jgi:hypothetical protein
MTAHILDWIKDLPSSLFKEDEIPLLGISQPFPWKEFSQKLSKAFNIRLIDIQSKGPAWICESDYFAGLGAPYEVFKFSIPPIQGKLYWAISRQDLSLLVSRLIVDDPQVILGDILALQDKELEEAFIKFIIFETIKVFNQLKIDPKISPQLIEQKEPSESSLPATSEDGEPALCLDLILLFNEAKMNARLIIPNELRRSWKDYISANKFSLLASHGIAQKVPVTIHAEAGKIDLTLEEWNQLQPGDLLIPDSCSLSSEEGEGEVLLTLYGERICQGSLDKNKIRIVEKFK